MSESAALELQPAALDLPFLLYVLNLVLYVIDLYDMNSRGWLEAAVLARHQTDLFYGIQEVRRHSWLMFHSVVISHDLPHCVHRENFYSLSHPVSVRWGRLSVL